MIDFQDQVVVVTGAARGLGRLYPADLACRGAVVVGHAEVADVLVRLDIAR